MKKQIEGFLQHKEHVQGRRPGTIAQYRTHLKRLARYLQELHGKGLEDATAAMLEDFAGLYLHRRGLKPRSRCGAVAAVRQFYAWMKATGRMRHNPAHGMEYPAFGRPLPYGMTLSNAQRLLMQPDLDTFTGLRDAAMLAILAGCGLRVSGLVALNESNLRQFPLDGERTGLMLRVNEKGGRVREVPVPNEARALVMGYLGHDELQAIDRTLTDGDRVLFVSVRNRRCPPDKYHGEHRRISIYAVRKMILHYGLAAGIPRAELHPHAMRHLYGTELAETGVDLLIRQALMGHADPKTTAIYTRLAMRKLHAAVEKGNPLSKIKLPVAGIARRLEDRGLW